MLVVLRVPGLLWADSSATPTARRTAAYENNYSSASVLEADASGYGPGGLLGYANDNLMTGTNYFVYDAPPPHRIRMTTTECTTAFVLLLYA